MKIFYLAMAVISLIYGCSTTQYSENPCVCWFEQYNCTKRWGVYREKNGDYYVGYFREGKKHGLGTLVQVDGTTIKGVWKEDQKVEQKDLDFSDALLSGSPKFQIDPEKATCQKRNSEKAKTVLLNVYNSFAETPVATSKGLERINTFGLPVKAGSYSIPNELISYLHGYQEHLEKQVVVEKPFLIQRREVTVGEFQLYVEQGLSKAEKQKLDPWWRKSSQEPVRWVSYEMAEGYAKWLGKKNGWDLHLPSISEWIAAVILYEESQPVLEDKPSTQSRKDVDHLLGNLREWSKNTCTTSDGKNGFKTLGDNFMTGTDPENRGNAYCLPGVPEAGVGFRLIRYGNN
ncbi:MAG: SUMF1/EgtB/PvdO family nonheme iron enzyme [Pseudomonadota bacterium]